MAPRVWRVTTRTDTGSPWAGVSLRQLRPSIRIRTNIDLHIVAIDADIHYWRAMTRIPATPIVISGA